MLLICFDMWVQDSFFLLLFLNRQFNYCIMHQVFHRLLAYGIPQTGMLATLAVRVYSLRRAPFIWCS